MTLIVFVISRRIYSFKSPCYLFFLLHRKRVLPNDVSLLRLTKLPDGCTGYVKFRE